MNQASIGLNQFSSFFALYVFRTREPCVVEFVQDIKQIITSTNVSILGGQGEAVLRQANPGEHASTELRGLDPMIR